MKENILKNCNTHGNVEHRYVANGDRYRCIKCQVESVQKRRLLLKQKAIDYKGGKCICCNYNRYNGALEFHHLNPEEKDFSIGAKGATKSWDKIKLELDKCVLVCSVCHKEIHAGIRILDV